MDVIFWGFIRSNKLRYVAFTCTVWTFNRLLDLFTDLAFGVFAIRWITKLLPNRLFDHLRTWRCSKLFSNRLFDPTLWWIVFKSFLTVLIYWLIDLFVNFRWNSDLFLLRLFCLKLPKAWMLRCVVFVKKLFQFTLCFTHFSLILWISRFNWFLYNISESDCISYLLTLFQYCWKYGIFIIKNELI